MIKKIGIGVLVLVVGLGIVAAVQPSSYEVERSKTMSASPEIVYGYLSDFHRWREWSPWDKLDPDMKREFSGAEKGLNAVYTWSGNDDVGQGKMTIIEAKPPRQVGIRLEFITPWEAVNTTRFTLMPGKNGTRVVWHMEGDKGGFMGKFFGLFMNFDAMIGKDFEAGLDQLALKAEAEMKRQEAAAAKAE